MDKHKQLCENIRAGNYEEVEALVKECKELVNQPTTDDEDAREYPLTIACKVENFKIVKLLLENGADPNIRDGWKFDEWTPLHIVAAYTDDNAEIFKILLEYGADLTAQDWDRRRPERFVHRYNHKKIEQVISEFLKKTSK